MPVDTQTQAILLLTAWLDKSTRENAKPLTPTEWGRFASWLSAQGRTPAQFLETGDLDALLEGWDDHAITRDRIESLLGRAAMLGLVLERWERAGLWVLSRSHHDYPRKLKTRLGYDSPATLVGCGNPQLLNFPSIAVLGSRDASDEDLAFTTTLGRAIAEGGHAVISGGARGVDEAAMHSALEAGGRAIGILADSLLRSATSAKYRSAIAAEQLVLVSSFNPEAGFNVGNAMARNKYIYCCAEAAVVVASGKSKGGTWNGAMEALGARWVPVWTRTTRSSPAGNAGLVRMGARDLGERVPTPHELTSAESAERIREAESLFALKPGDAPKSVSATLSLQHERPQPAPESSEQTLDQVSFVEFFVMKFAGLAKSSALSAAEIARGLDISKAQVSAWLSQATEQGLVAKLSRPVRYRVIADALRAIETRSRPD